MPTEVIPFEGIDKLGLFRDTPSIALPPGAFSDVFNVRFDDGSIRKVRGYAEIFNALTLTDIQHIAYWPNPNGSVYIVVNRESNRDRLYAIRIDNGTLTSTDIGQGDNGYRVSGNWQSTLFNGGYTIILNPGNGVPQHATDEQGSTNLPDFADLPNWESYMNDDSEQITAVTAGIILSFGNVLLAGDLRETRTVGSDSEVRDLRGVVRSSNIAAAGSIPNNWNPFATGAGTADEIIIADTGRITAMETLQGRVMVYTANSIAQLSVSANGLTEINITRQYGAISNGSVFEFDGRHIVLGSNDIYSFSGHPSSIQSISDGKVRRFYYDDVHSAGTTLTTIVRNQTFDEIWICYRSQANGTATLDRALTWNYRDNTWSRRELPNLRTIDVGPITGGGIASTEYVFAGDTTSTAYAGVSEIQRIDYTGARSNVVGVTDRARITLPSNFNSGVAPFTSNSSAASGTVDIGNGLSVEIDSNHSYSGRDMAVLLPASNGSSISNPLTATYNPTDEFRFVDWPGAGSTSSNTLRAYRVVANNLGAAGARIFSSWGPSRVTYSQGGAWTNGGAESGSITPGTTITASNISGGVTFQNFSGTSNGSTVRSIIGASGGSAVGISSRGANPGSAWSGGLNSASFNGQVLVYTSVSPSPQNLRIVLMGGAATYTGRRARLTNSNNYAVTITGTWGSLTLAANTSTSYVTANAQTISWNVTVTPPAVTYSFDPDTSADNRVYSNSIVNQSLPANQNAEQSLTIIGNAIAALHGPLTFNGTVGTEGDNRFIDIQLGTTLVISQSLGITTNSGTNTVATLAELDIGGLPASTYVVRDYLDRQIINFTGGAIDAATPDLTEVLSRITTAINSNVETPIDFTAATDTGETRIDISATTPGRVIGTDGMPTGQWSITATHGTDANAGDIAFTYNAATGRLGEDAGLATTAVISITEASGTVVPQTVSFTDSSNNASVAEQFAAFINDSVDNFNATHTTGEATVTVESLQLGAAAGSFDVVINSGTNRRSASRDTTPTSTTVSFTTTGENDAERPWSESFINDGINFVLGATDSEFFAQDVSYSANGAPLLSYIERKNIHVRPTKDTEMVQTFFLDTMGDPILDDPNADSSFILRLNVTNAAGNANAVALENDTGNTVYGFDYNGNDSDYKTDVRLTGRILNYRVEDNSSNGWSIASISMEVGKGGTR